MPWEPGLSFSPHTAQIARWAMGLVPAQCLTVSLAPRFVPPGHAGAEDEAGAEEAAIHRSLSREARSVECSRRTPAAVAAGPTLVQSSWGAWPGLGNGPGALTASLSLHRLKTRHPQGRAKSPFVRCCKSVCKGNSRPRAAPCSYSVEDSI